MNYIVVLIEFVIFKLNKLNYLYVNNWSISSAYFFTVHKNNWKVESQLMPQRETHQHGESLHRALKKFNFMIMTCATECIFNKYWFLLQLRTALHFVSGGLNYREMKRMATLHTIHGELGVVLPGEAVVCDGDLHRVRPFVWELQVVKQQRPILQHQDAVAVLGPQVPDDLRPDGLHDGDGFLFAPLQLPLDHGLVGAAAGVADWQQGLFAHRAPHHLALTGHVHPRHLTWTKTRRDGAEVSNSGSVQRGVHG